MGSSFRRLTLITVAISVAVALCGCSTKGVSNTLRSFVNHLNGKNNSVSTTNIGPVRSGKLVLITEPDQGIGPILTAITGARTSVDLVMYELSDQKIESALVADHHRGVRVRVLLNGGYYGKGFPQNKPAFSYLKAHGVSVRWTPSRFALTHQKTMVVDGKTAYIMTFNLTSQYYSTSRDFDVTDRQPSDVRAILQVFTADWNNTKLSPPNGSDLVWSPGALKPIIRLISSAHKSIDVYNEEMDEPQITVALAAAARRGVKVEVVMTADSEWNSAFSMLTANKAYVRLYPNTSTALYIHAKMFLVDGKKAFLGSQNASNTSLERNRELGIMIRSHKIIHALTTVFNSDYAHAPETY
jgi:cardiolipin synthase